VLVLNFVPDFPGQIAGEGKEEKEMQ